MQCARCQHPTLPGAKFCQECGAPLPRSCATCGQVLAASAKFCSECGTAAGMPTGDALVAPQPLVPDAIAPDATGADRRQAAVLFADISGYTALCARSDPEDIQAMLGRFFDAMDHIVEDHGGRVFDRAGDAVMAVFGAPVAHGNDAQRAVRAALAMHAAAATLSNCDGAPLRLHIGIASGEVVAAVISGGGKSKYSVTGDTVNLAARLDALADPGDTLISDALYRAVSTVVDAHAGGEHAVKGFVAPVKVWKVVGLRQAQAERLPFVGRQAELRQLVGALDELRETGRGVAMVLRGDAGIGKSRLAEEFRARARGAGLATAAGQVLDFGVARGQDAVPMLLKDLLGIAAQDDAALRRRALDLATGSGLVVADEELFVNEWLDLAQPAAMQAVFDAMDNATRQRRAADSLASVLRRAAQRQPLLVMVEDIHWASADLLRQLAAATRAAASAPLILLLTTRIEGDPLDKAWRASVHGSALLTVDVAPLRADEAQRLAAGVIEASSRFAMQCIERAEGNPLFLEQLLRSVRESGAPDVPPTIQSLVLERMDRLAAPDRAALQAAAVIGKRFSLRDLRGVSAQLQPGCDGLVAADLVRPDGGDFLFAHALIQEAVYASTLKSRRRELHRAAAAWFGESEAVLQAEHLDRAEDPGAAQACWRAARTEAARHRFESALRFAERGGAIALQGGGADAADIGCELALLRGELLRELGHSSESIAAYQAARELAVHDRQRCRAAMGIAAGHRITGAFDAAMQALDEAQPIAELLGLADECSRIHHTRGNLYFAQARIADCEAQHTLALQYAQRAGDVECEAYALSGLGDASYAQVRMHRALGYFRRCVALCGDQVRISGPNRCMIGHCLWYANDLAAAVAEAQAACDDAQRFGLVPVQVFAQTCLTQFLTEAGRFKDAELACAHGLTLARAVGSRRYESTMLLWSAELQLRRGERDQARRDLDQGLALARESGIGFAGAALHARLARVATSAQERAKALSDGEALMGSAGMAHRHLWFYRDAIEATLAVGEWSDALHYAGALEDFVRAEPLPWALLIVERARAIVGLAQAGTDPAARERLQRTREVAVAGGVGWALAGIDAALAAA
jgi:class 3 adenylate cyclase/tetratricopeptide (TPR) repeat protein